MFSIIVFPVQRYEAEKQVGGRGCTKRFWLDLGSGRGSRLGDGDGGGSGSGGGGHSDSVVVVIDNRDLGPSRNLGKALKTRIIGLRHFKIILFL